VPQLCESISIVNRDSVSCAELADLSSVGLRCDAEIGGHGIGDFGPVWKIKQNQIHREGQARPDSQIAAIKVAMRARGRPNGWCWGEGVVSRLRA